MKRILLTGAGFSANWGGYLARQVGERLLSHSSVRKHPGILEILRNRIEDFESALAEVRALGEGPTDVLESALIDVFEEQDRVMMGDGTVYPSYNPDRFNHFIDRFRDGDRTALVFTLNQDLFLERRYRHGLTAPGVGEIGFRAGGDPLMDEHRRRVDVNATPDIRSGEVNYFKLHGSFNWRAAGHTALVVAGHDKLGQLETSYPILKGYLEQFRAECRRPDTLLVVSGYRFYDPHINEAIADGVQAGLHLTIADTASAQTLLGGSGGEAQSDALRHRDIWRGVVGYCSLPFNRIFGGHPLGETLVSDLLDLASG